MPFMACSVAPSGGICGEARGASMTMPGLGAAAQRAVADGDKPANKTALAQLLRH
ncbi:hypothetical protein GCM10007977_026050 [Dactylosporangium sucinum]|uniref:Uncharacterized protein n=1 Tax=Dactylosporangium sucinum TaxID=1424081 RepID=A0A917WRN5_9ACTN|nr:hypothetical protein GCM10007977_026050 [Dactylosporangium sucinum]